MSLTRQIHADLIARGLMTPSKRQPPARRFVVSTSKVTYRPDDAGVPFNFAHGLGDCVCLAHQIPLYSRRGHVIKISCAPDFAPLFRAAEADCVKSAKQEHYWFHPDAASAPGGDWRALNKPWANLSAWPLPFIGRNESLWREYLDVRIDFAPHAGPRQRVDALLADFKRPITLFHPAGSEPLELRGLADDVQREFLARMLGTVIVLSPKAVEERAALSFQATDLGTLYWLLKSADLFVGIDSGPAHFVRLTDTPALVVWREQTYPLGRPQWCALPRAETLHLVDCAAEVPAEYNPRIYYQLSGAILADSAMAALKKIDTIPPREKPAENTILISARHGLGDSVQLGIVLDHLRKHQPDKKIELAVLADKAGVFAWRLAAGELAALHAAATVQELDELLDRCADQYAAVYDLVWPDPEECYTDCPSTKVEKCLREVFGLEPDPDLCANYRLEVGEAPRRRAAEYLAKITRGKPSRADGRYPALVIHYQGEHSKPQKDLEDHEAAWIARNLGRDYGLVPIVLDWSRSPPFVEQQRAHCPPASFWRDSPAAIAHPDSAELLAALIDQSALCVAIDSGPGHVAGATSTPTIVVWKDLHPLHYHHPCSNVTHFVPAGHERHLKANAAAGLDFFTRHYTYRIYQSFLADLHGLAADVLGERGLVFMHNHWVRTTSLNQDLVIVEDVYEGDCYRLAEIPLAREVIVDVGACLGSFSRLCYDRNPRARIVAVECCPENWELLERNLAGLAEVERAALTYERDVALLNSVYPGCASTGGSTIVPWQRAVDYVAGGPQGRPGTVDEHGQKREYFADFRPLALITLEQLREKYALDRIDILKLDCEGSEYSILAHAELSCVRAIVGEHHGRARWEAFLPGLLARLGDGWRYEQLRGGDFGLFRLTRT